MWEVPQQIKSITAEQAACDGEVTVIKGTATGRVAAEHNCFKSVNININFTYTRMEQSRYLSNKDNAKNVVLV